MAVPARFRYPSGKAKSRTVGSWLAENGFEVAATCGRASSSKGPATPSSAARRSSPATAFRSDMRGHQRIGDLLACRVISLELVDPRFYHLDTCFCPLAPGVAIYYPGGLRRLRPAGAGGGGRRADPGRRRRGPQLRLQRRGAWADGGDQRGLPRVAPRTWSAGFTPRATPLGEFVKAGGSAKCLTLRLDGEEAALWRAAAAAVGQAVPDSEAVRD